MQAAALAVERAKKIGVCFGLIRETTHTGAIGRYAQWIAKQDCAAIIMGAGPALMAYHGARVAQHGDEPDRDRGAERQRPDPARHGDQHDLERQNPAGARDRASHCRPAPY